MARILRQSIGKYQLEGELDFDSVPALLEDSIALFSQDESDLEIDMAGIQRANSAALGLMLEWMQFAQQRNRGIYFLHVPDHLLDIAHVSDLDNILPVRH